MSESEKSRRLKQFGACLMVCGTAVCGGTELPPDRELRELAVREGIFCGVSSGGAIAGALRVAKANPGAVVVAIICDRGDRYLSTGVFGEEHFSQGAGI